jgi:hypothetical protein
MSLANPAIDANYSDSRGKEKVRIAESNVSVKRS